MRIVFTGGSGKAGRHAVPYLVDRGHEVLNVDLVRSTIPASTRSSPISPTAARSSTRCPCISAWTISRPARAAAPIDAVVHFAAIPRVLIRPDNETFRINTIDLQRHRGGDETRASARSIIASSETTYGVCFAEGDKDFHQFPLEEDYDIDPMDSYGLSKVVNEKTARAFAMRYRRRHLRAADRQRDRAGRIRPVPDFLADPMSRKRNAWSYIDARDLGQIVHRCPPRTGSASRSSTPSTTPSPPTMPTAEFLKNTAPDTPITREMGNTRRRCRTARPRGARLQGRARLAPRDGRRLRREGAVCPPRQRRVFLQERGAVCSPRARGAIFFRRGAVCPRARGAILFRRGAVCPPRQRRDSFQRGAVCPPRRARGPPPPEDIFGQKVMPRFACMRAGRGVAAMHRGAGGPRGVAPRG